MGKSEPIKRPKGGRVEIQGVALSNPVTATFGVDMFQAMKPPPTTKFYPFKSKTPGEAGRTRGPFFTTLVCPVCVAIIPFGNDSFEGQWDQSTDTGGGN